MKKTGLLMAGLLLAATGASAQTVVNNPANHAYFGIRGALDITTPNKVNLTKNTDADVFGSSPGFSLGMIYNQPVVANFYVQPGLSLYYNTTGIDHDFLNSIPGVKVEHASLRKFGMRVPVMLGYHFDFQPVSLHIFTGPELDVAFSNDYYTEMKAGDITYKKSGTTLGDNRPFNRVDCYWKVGVGVNFAKNYYVDVTGGFGLTNQLKNGDHDYPSWHENYVSVTLGYNF